MPKKSVKKVKVQGYVHPLLYDQMVRLAEEKQVTISDIIVAGANAVVDMNKKEEK